MAYETIRFDVKEGVAIATISRPKALNALNAQVVRELDAIITDVESNHDIRALILTGEGEKAFVAGADINQFGELDPKEAYNFARHGQKILARLESLRVPVIAAVNGFCLGGGLELALSCDFIYASENARLGLPEVTLGLIPGYGGTQRLARFVGLPMARELIYSGRHIKAEEAKAIGLVNKVVPAGEVVAAAETTAREIASRGPIAVWRAKVSINQGYDLALDAGLDQEAEQFREIFFTEDMIEGTSAFLEKRPAKFQGK